MIVHGPDTNTQLAPGAPSALLKSSVNVVMVDHLLPVVRQGQVATGRVRVREPDGRVNVSPAVTAFAVIVPEPPNVPAVDAVHIEKCVYCSLPATDVQTRSALEAFDAAEAAAHVACL